MSPAWNQNTHSLKIRAAGGLKLRQAVEINCQKINILACFLRYLEENGRKREKLGWQEFEKKGLYWM